MKRGKAMSLLWFTWLDIAKGVWNEQIKLWELEEVNIWLVRGLFPTNVYWLDTTEFFLKVIQGGVIGCLHTRISLLGS
jgi:hypothetical protein